MTNRENMTAHRKSAVIVGVLFIIATAFLFIGEAVYKPSSQCAGLSGNYLPQSHNGDCWRTARIRYRAGYAADCHLCVSDPEET